jgi:hypothetical protein
MYLYRSKLSLYRPWRLVSLCDFEDPTLPRHSAHRWRLGCQPYAPASLYSPEIFSPVSDTQICFGLSSSHDLLRLEELELPTHERSVPRLLVTARVVPRSPILVTLMKEALSSSESRFLQEPHAVTSQTTPFFIVTAVKTSNLTQY